MSDHDNIAMQAYRLWEESGRPESRELEFWLKAEAEIVRRSQAPTPLGKETPAATNPDRAFPPAKHHRTRSVRTEADRMPKGTGPKPPLHFVAVLDRAHLHIYRLREDDEPARAQFELAESFELPAGREHYTDRDTDQAGRFRARIGPGGASIDERLPMQTEQERRLAAELADHLERFLVERSDATWDYSAGPGLHQAVLDRLSPSVRSRLEVALVKELVHQTPAQLRSYFTS